MHNACIFWASFEALLEASEAPSGTRYIPRAYVPRAVPGTLGMASMIPSAGCNNIPMSPEREEKYTLTKTVRAGAE